MLVLGAPASEDMVWWDAPRLGRGSTLPPRSWISYFNCNVQPISQPVLNFSPPVFSFLLEGASTWEIPYCTVTYFTVFL